MMYKAVRAEPLRGVTYTVGSNLFFAFVQAEVLLGLLRAFVQAEVLLVLLRGITFPISVFILSRVRRGPPKLVNRAGGASCCDLLLLLTKPRVIDHLPTQSPSKYQQNRTPFNGILPENKVPQREESINLQN